MKSVEINLALPEDYENLLNLYNEALQRKLSLGDTTWDENPFEAHENEGMAKLGSLYTAKDSVGEILGAVLLSEKDATVWPEGGDALYINKLVRSDQARGLDLGKLLIDFCMEKAVKKGVAELRLDSEESNTKLLDYYKSLGFEDAGSRYINDGFTSHRFRKTL